MVLRSIKSSANKRRILQSLASTYPCNAILFKWGRLPSPACTLCGGDNESLSHVQCICPALQDARIRAHDILVTGGRLGQASQKWAIHRELTTAAGRLLLLLYWTRSTPSFAPPGGVRGSGAGRLLPLPY